MTCYSLFLNTWYRLSIFCFDFCIVLVFCNQYKFTNVLLLYVGLLGMQSLSADEEQGQALFGD